MGIKEQKLGARGNSFDEIYGSLKDEFQSYKEFLLAGLESEYRTVIKMGLMQKKELGPALEKKRLELSKCDSEQRISLVLNNFWMWWPGGWYRQILKEREEKPDSDAKKLMADRQLVANLDEEIHAAGYDSIAENIGKRKDVSKGMRLKVLADVYLNMRKKGYKRLRLSI